MLYIEIFPDCVVSAEILKWCRRLLSFGHKTCFFAKHQSSHLTPKFVEK